MQERQHVQMALLTAIILAFSPQVFRHHV